MCRKGKAEPVLLAGAAGGAGGAAGFWGLLNPSCSKHLDHPKL